MSELKFDYFYDVKEGVISPDFFKEIERDLKEFDCRVWISLKKKRKTVSTSQRGYYFDCIVPCFQQGALAEWGEHLSKQSAHENLKLHCNFKEAVNHESGEITKIILSSEGINTLEREEYHERCRKKIYEFFNIVVPLPNEQTDIDFNRADK